MSVAFRATKVDEGMSPNRADIHDTKDTLYRENTTRSPNNSLEESRLNPHAKLRIQLIKEGICEKEIDSALEAMWERELPYDDFTAVMNFIHGRNAVKEQSDSIRTAKQYPPEEETKTTSTAESTSTSTNEREIGNGDIQTIAKSEQTVNQTRFLKSENILEQRKSALYPLNISSKLDLVADYENLADAAFALSEWVAKAADRDQIHELCVAAKTRALPTVIRRTIAETPDKKKYGESVLPSILHLVGSIFLNAGMSSAAASATRKSLESVINLARMASMKKKDTEHVFADRVSRYVVSRISTAIQDLKSQGSDEGVDLILRLEDEIESLASSLVTGDGGVIELINKRDSTKVAAEKSSTVVGVAMATSFRGFEISEDSDYSVVDKEDILNNIVGRAEIEQMKNNKLILRDMEEKMKVIEKSNSEERMLLKSNLKTYQAERELVAERMNELRIAMKQLEEDDAELNAIIEETEMKLSTIEENNRGEVRKMVSNLEESKEIADLEKSVESLVDSLKIYEDSLKKAVTVSNIFENCENVDEFVPNKLGIYLVHVKNYFTSESDCVDFLRNRIIELEKEGAELKREIEECKALDMHATVSQMLDSLSLNCENISDDKCVVDGLILEAQNMLTNLIGRLDQYLSDDNLQRKVHELDSLHITLIRAIAGTVEIMGLDGVCKLKAFLPNSNDDFPTVVTTSYDESDESDTDLELCNEVEHSETEDEGARKPVNPREEESSDELTNNEPASVFTRTQLQNGENIDRPPENKSCQDTLVKKLTWASPAVQARKPAVKSLIDIQREELSCKKKYEADGT